ncbi:GAF domain-containing protein [Sporichthya polymorpha]|uniref:GAF domain-containing protein n=1 Tax=Sporichthya polymorpha TaxID=35751 RepID=UPI0003773F7C|nr:GAF domain-containing protein [Sporichthya polymorpha]
MAKDDATLVAETVAAVQDAASLDDALHGVVRLLRPRFDLWHASFCAQPSEEPSIRILASWSLAESVFDPGTEINATISEIILRVLDELREGNPTAFLVGEDRESIVDHLLEKQGVSSVVTVPIHYDGQLLLFLALGASTGEAFHTAGRRFFTELSLGIGETVVRLVSPSAPGR